MIEALAPGLRRVPFDAFGAAAHPLARRNQTGKNRTLKKWN
jgi:hypothetical protein